MRIPRDLSGADLAKALQKLGYTITRQTGSHLRLTRVAEEEHHVTIPHHRELRVGTLSNILADVAEHLKKTKAELVLELWGKS